MQEVTITIPFAAALNLKHLVEARLEEIERLAKQYPDLPMKDPATVESYAAAQRALVAAVGTAGEVSPSPNNPQHAVWTDPDGLTWEFRYIVTQTEAEGPEYLEYREFEPRSLAAWVKIEAGEAWEVHGLSEETERKLEKFFCG